MASDKNKLKNGSVYTPQFMANYVASLLVKYHNRYQKLPEANPLRAIDPAVGDGELLDSLIHGLSLTKTQDISGQIVQLIGLDTNQVAIRRSKKRFMPLKSDVTLIRHTTQFHTVNALFPFGKNKQDGWARLSKVINVNGDFDFVIANPPWGADIDGYKELLANGEFDLASGQFDTSDLFLELSKSLLREGGLFAFIIPDSVFNFERHPLRKFLLKSFDLLFIGRLGEGIFPNVNRGCAVIVARKGKSTKTIFTDCFRLSAADRNLVIQGKKSLEKITRETLHKVPQKRFLKNRNYEFDIDAKVADRYVLRKFYKGDKNFGDFLVSSRGVELSKNGRVCKCEACGLWMPMPKEPVSSCRHCKTRIDINQIESKGIVVNHLRAGYEPIIVGENIFRYKIETNHWISTLASGIKYKNAELYKGPKIVVRKTGVGITASIDYSSQLTNQVVYILKLKTEDKNILPIEYFLALLNSRAMYYFSIMHSGETEWRSHPYITQQQLLGLPIPYLQSEAIKAKLVSKIAKLAVPYLKTGRFLPPEVDAEIEQCLARLFGLTKTDYKKIYDTLDGIQSLIPVRSLMNISVADIFA